MLVLLWEQKFWFYVFWNLKLLEDPGM